MRQSRCAQCCAYSRGYWVASIHRESKPLKSSGLCALGFLGRNAEEVATVGRPHLECQHGWDAPPGRQFSRLAAVRGDGHQARYALVVVEVSDLVPVRGKRRVLALALHQHPRRPSQRGDHFDAVLVRPGTGVKNSLAIWEERRSVYPLVAVGQLDRVPAAHLLQPQLLFAGAVRNVGHESAIG